MSVQKITAENFELLKNQDKTLCFQQIFIEFRFAW